MLYTFQISEQMRRAVDNSLIHKGRVLKGGFFEKIACSHLSSLYHSPSTKSDLIIVAQQSGISFLKCKA